MSRYKFVVRKAFIFLLFIIPSLGDTRSTHQYVMLANKLIGTQYRTDGVRNNAGSYTSFSDQNILFKYPGLNCSGLVVELARNILHLNITIDEAKFDFNYNSSSQNNDFQDWDFGYDLINNILNKSSGRVIGHFTYQEFFHLIDDPTIVSTQKLYLVSFTRIKKRPLTFTQYYHVGVFVVDGDGQIYFYHATPILGTHRINLTGKKGKRQFLKELNPKNSMNKKIYVVELDIFEESHV